MPDILIRPIGFVRGGRAHPDDDNWGAVEAEIVLDAAQFGPEALAGLEDFSHIEVIFHFHGVAADDVEKGARRPRNNPAWPKVGMFAQRGRRRPNRLGATICELLSVHGTTLKVRGLDAIDGTPVIDIKPMWQGFLPRGTMREPEWATELMKDYW